MLVFEDYVFFLFILVPQHIHMRGRVAIPDTFAVSFVCSIVVDQQYPRNKSHQVLTDQFIPVAGGFECPQV